MFPDQDTEMLKCVSGVDSSAWEKLSGCESIKIQVISNCVPVEIETGLSAHPCFNSVDKA